MSAATRRSASARWRRWATSLLTPDDTDDGTERVGHDRGEVAVGRIESLAGSGDDEQRTPRAVAPRDGRGELFAVTGQDRRRDPVAAASDDGRGAGRLVGSSPRSGRREIDGLAEHAEAAG
jgi:hypothetical protein